MGASISIYIKKKRESIVVGSPMNIEQPPGIRNSNYKNTKKKWNNFLSKSKSYDKYEDEII